MKSQPPFGFLHRVPAPGIVQFSFATYSVAEDGASVTITVTRTAGAEGAASVNYATSNGTGVAGVNYTATSGTLTWEDTDDASKTFSIPVLNVPGVNADATVNLTLSVPVLASLGTIATAVLTITNVYVAVASAYNGTTQYRLLSSALAANSTKFTFSCFVELTAVPPAGAGRPIVYSFTANEIDFKIVQFDATHYTFAVVLTTGFGALVFSGMSTPNILRDGNFHHFFARGDSAGGVPPAIYVDGGLSATGTIPVASAIIPWALTSWAVAARIDGGFQLNACISELFLHTGVDCGNHPELFRNPTTGKPVYLGANGQIPCGSTPAIYAPSGDPIVNLGTAGNFPGGIAPTVCATAP